MAPDTAAVLTEALWAAIVEVAERGNNSAVVSQAHPNLSDANELASLAIDLEALSRAAAASARWIAAASLDAS